MVHTNMVIIIVANEIPAFPHKNQKSSMTDNLNKTDILVRDKIVHMSYGLWVTHKNQVKNTINVSQKQRHIFALRVGAAYERDSHNLHKRRPVQRLDALSRYQPPRVLLHRGRKVPAARVLAREQRPGYTRVVTEVRFKTSRIQSVKRFF